MSQAALEALGVIWAPTENELPSDDGMPLETPRQAAEAQHQATALEALLARYRERFGDLPDAER